MKKYTPQRLTMRELEAVAWASQGMTRPEIADRMGVVRQTVAYLLGRVFVKTGTFNAAHAVWVCRHRIEHEMQDIWQGGET